MEFANISGIWGTHLLIYSGKGQSDFKQDARKHWPGSEKREWHFPSRTPILQSVLFEENSATQKDL